MPARTPATLAVVLMLLFTACSDDAGEKSRQDQTTNVILITLDTVRADALGAYGDPSGATPTLDRMASEGVLFEQVLSAAPHTLASHASIMTGLYPFIHGARANHGGRLAVENETLAEILRDEGYRTRAEIAAPVLHATTRISQGFEDPTRRHASTTKPAHTVAATQQTSQRRSASNITDRGIEALRDFGDRPFMLWLHYFDAHLPYAPCEPECSRYAGNRYLGQIAVIDAQIKRILTELESQGVRERTLVVVTSDHGEGLGEHAEPTHSYFVYESTMRVPLILWGPTGLARGLRVPDLASTVDILPTVLAWLGLEPRPELHGRSWAGMLGTKRTSPRPTESAPERVAYGESLDLYRIFGTTPMRTIRQGQWKYIHGATAELYDLSVDPEERNNIIALHPERAKQMLIALVSLVAKSERETQAIVEVSSPELRAQLAALGYVEPVELSGAESRLSEAALLALRGPAPRELAQHAEALSRAKGSIAAKKFARALKTLEPVVAAHPESPTVLSMLGEALAGAGESEQSLALLRKARDLDGDPCSEVRLDLARAHERFGQEKDRIETLEDALAACPDSPTYLNELAWARATTKQTRLRDARRAVSLARRLIERGDGEPDPNHLDTYAAALAASGDFRFAAETQERALKILKRSGASEKERNAYRATADRYRAQAPDGG